MKPNLFIVGAPKCGTTAWAAYLGEHPDIHFSPIKEPGFFCADFPGRQHVSTQEDYDALFRNAGDSPVVGEASVLYLFSEVAADEIAKFNPEARILIFLREQEDMLPSLHHQFLYSFNENIEDFETAWHLSGRRPEDTIPATCLEPKLLDYKRMGMFKEQIERYYSAFPADQVRVLHFQDWKKNPRLSYLEIMDFLGLADDGRMDFGAVNTAKYHHSRWLGRLLQHPPTLLSAAISQVKRKFGSQSLGIGARLAAINRGKGYSTRIDEYLKDEIKNFYKTNNDGLRTILSRNKT